MSDNARNENGKFVPGNPYAWAPGQSGNRNGRPKGSKTGTAALRRIARKLIDPKTGTTAEEVIAAKLVNMAMSGDLKAIELFYNRLEGKPGVRVEAEHMDWRERADAFGLSVEDVIAEAKHVFEQQERLQLESDTRPGSHDVN